MLNYSSDAKIANPKIKGLAILIEYIIHGSISRTGVLPGREG
ncbi:MAG: hypothetical protein K0R34_744 [Herbinix sp.]|jgi:hypothetical protein|nr:hypothetical protein [Herbinix sp.]